MATSQQGKPSQAVEPQGLAGLGRWWSLFGEVRPFRGAEWVPLKHKLIFLAASWAAQSVIPIQGPDCFRVCSSRCWAQGHCGAKRPPVLS